MKINFIYNKNKQSIKQALNEYLKNRNGDSID